MKLLIEIWGNYNAWKNVTYTYGDKTVNSSTTLPLLLDSIKPDSSIIIVADTLLENEIAYNTVTLDSNDKNFYSTVCSAVERSTKTFIHTSLENFDVKDFVNTISVIVAPAVGTFNHTHFNGNPNNFFSYIYYYLAKTAVTIAQNTHESLEIYLDITHGINYMTMMTYRAIKDICSILAYFFNVTFIVLNSDPYVGAENTNLNINKIEKSKINPVFNFFKYPQFDSGKWLKVSPNIDNEKKATVNKNLQEHIKAFSPNTTYIDQCYCFASAVYNALPLFIVNFYPDIHKLITTIDRIVKVFFDHISMYHNNKNNKLTVQQQVDLTPSFISLVQISLFAQCLANKYNVEKKEECTITTLYDVIDLYSTFKAFKSRINRELIKIEEAIKQYPAPLSTYTVYGYILMGDKYEQTHTVDDRNFFAHAGLTYDNIQIKKFNDTIFIKPKDESVANITNVLLNNIPLGLE